MLHLKYGQLIYHSLHTYRYALKSIEKPVLNDAK